MARLYADEDFYYPVVLELRRLGHDVLTVQEAGQAGADDPVVLAFATSHGRAVVTCNRRHFMRLHRQSTAHAGIVVCTRDQDFPALANRIHQAISTYPSLTGQLIRIVRPPRP
jgi:hypothetical protein